MQALSVRHAFFRSCVLVLALAVASTALSGCGMFRKTKKIGSTAKGTRISIMAYDKELTTDPALATAEVKLPPPYVNDSWPEPGGFASHAMYHLAAGTDLKKVWQVSVGAAADSYSQILAPPIVAQGMVFVLDARCHVTAIDAETGKRVWRIDLTPKGERPRVGFGGGIAYDNGSVFAVTGFGRIHALNAATGEERWQRTMPAPFHAAPTADGGRVFAVTQDNELNVLAEDDGRVLWTHQGIIESAGLLGSSSPAVSGETVVVPYSSGELYALRVQNGRVGWSDSLTRIGQVNAMSTINDIAGGPVIDRGHVIAISHSGRLVSIDLGTGARTWTRDASGIQMPWVAGDYIYVVTTEAELLCVSAQTGGIRWLTQLQRFRNMDDKVDPIVWTGPVLVGNRLVLASSRGRAISVSPYTGEILGEIKIPGPTFVPPVVAGSKLYILTEDAKLVAYQ